MDDEFAGGEVGVAEWVERLVGKDVVSPSPSVPGVINGVDMVYRDRGELERPVLKNIPASSEAERELESSEEECWIGKRQKWVDGDKGVSIL